MANETIRKQQPTQEGGERREMPRPAPEEGVQGTPRKEDLLREQELSTERQREGRGWQRLEPGQSSGTTPVQTTPLDEMPRAEEGGVTPGAARAEHEGTPRKKR